MVSEGYIYVLVRIDGRHVLPVCKSRYVVYSFFLVLISDVANVVAWLLYDVLYTILSSYSTLKNFLSP